MKTRVLLRVAGALVALVVVAIGAATAGAKTSVTVPSSLNGLTTTRANVTGAVKQAGQAQYLDSVELYTLRSGKLLQATLQVGHLSDQSRFASLNAQRGTASLMGSTVPLVLRVSGSPVYLTSSRRLSIMVWFRHGYMYVLAVRDTYNEPKTLLRAALSVGP